MTLIAQAGIFALAFMGSAAALASHNFGGLDMCTLYPETMPPGLSADRLPEAGGRDAILMQRYCTQCHELPGPGQHTSKEWPEVLDRMLMLMDVANRFSGLLGKIKMPAPSERQNLRAYLDKYALLPMKQKPQGPGAGVFERHCSACHALPDPARYKFLDWPNEIKRMQRNMLIMKYPPPSPDTMMQIQLYLQQYATYPSSTNHMGLPADSGNKKTTQPSHNARWLALGPFFLLAILGMARWWISRSKNGCPGESVKS